MTEESTNVVQFESFRPKKVEHVFTCLCGTQTFFLHKSGRIQCESCLEIKVELAWGDRQ
jgi:hypothetical protein